jgi:Fe-S-cluster containining protein
MTSRAANWPDIAADAAVEVNRLHRIQSEIRARVEEITSTHGSWPCRKGCDDCCRQLACVPRVSREEWLPIADAIDALPVEFAKDAWQRIRDSASSVRPVVCPLLDANSRTCLVYEARPLACRAYGFYAERRQVLGCHRIESLSRESPDVVWGNHGVLEERMQRLGPDAELFVWQASEAESG